MSCGRTRRNILDDICDVKQEISNETSEIETLYEKINEMKQDVSRKEGEIEDLEDNINEEDDILVSLEEKLSFLEDDLENYPEEEMRNGDYVIEHGNVVLWMKIDGKWLMFYGPDEVGSASGEYYDEDLNNPDRKNVFDELL